MENPEEKSSSAKVEKPEKTFSKWDEEILVLDKTILEKNNFFDLFKNGSYCANYGLIGLIKEQMWNKAGSVARRGDVEEDFNYLQPIPYTLIKQGDEYFAYERLSGGGEARLHNMFSIGVGGHANMFDNYFNFEHLMVSNNSRELEEEVAIIDENGNHTDCFQLAKEAEFKGFGYTDKTDVDKVHLAMYYVVSIPKNWNVTVRETDTLRGSFLSIQEIKNIEEEGRLENWSSMILEGLLEPDLSDSFLDYFDKEEE